VLDDGDIVYNYEHLGLVRLDLCGGVVWRLPYRTHHSVHRDDDGDLWVSAQINRTEKDPRYPSYRPEFIEPVALEVSEDGRIKSEISILDLLRDNDLSGLLYMPARDNRNTSVGGDTLHLNDVEPFPSSMKTGAFSPGDLLISLRNIHTVLVFRPTTRRITHVWTGGFVRQHDPDFLDGNTISVFDNNNIGPASAGQQSRILLLSATSGERTVYYVGGQAAPFYSYLMGKHQWLPNGNLLISETMRGRAFEFDRDGRIVWEYMNVVEEGYAAVMEEVQRLPERMSPVFSAANISAKCPAVGNRSRRHNDVDRSDR
jgi:Arylsulfotransferase (ASST)